MSDNQKQEIVAAHKRITELMTVRDEHSAVIVSIESEIVDLRSRLAELMSCPTGGCE